jgi:hypothetical protein
VPRNCSPATIRSSFSRHGPGRRLPLCINIVRPGRATTFHLTLTVGYAQLFQLNRQTVCLLNGRRSTSARLSRVHRAQSLSRITRSGSLTKRVISVAEISAVGPPNAVLNGFPRISFTWPPAALTSVAFFRLSRPRFIF